MQRQRRGGQSVSRILRLTSIVGTLTLLGCHAMMSGGHTPVDTGGMQDMDLTVVNLNLLHGFNCDAKPAPHASATQCRLSDRIDLLFHWLGHPFKAGHPASSSTCREGLTTLPWHGQLVEL